jgi:farnesyl-diphosphate farnesyltransferase
VHSRDPAQECETLRQCFYYLDATSRSFAAVIKELHPELLVPVALFYLTLRGLDTIEDDPTIELDQKDVWLREFHTHLEEDGWTFTQNGPNEKDRELLVHFDVVIAELKKIKRPYFDIIHDITIKMENGMADYVRQNADDPEGVRTIGDYEKYCHYAAGVVGEGLTRLFVEAKLANPKLLERPHLQESMGQFLQQTNVIRDIREDHDDNRRWWPHEVWSKYADEWDDMFTLANRERAMQATSELVLNALGKVEDCLFYMAGVREQSVFNFVAIPQAMAIATLELVFRNPAVFERNVKITKGDACQLMIESTQNLQTLCDVFRRYARRIHAKNDPRDPNFMAIGSRCAKVGARRRTLDGRRTLLTTFSQIEQFIESLFPSQTPEKVAAEYKAKAENPGSSASEVLVLIGVVVGSLVFLSGMMVSGTNGGREGGACVLTCFSRLARRISLAPSLTRSSRTARTGPASSTTRSGWWWTSRRH